MDTDDLGVPDPVCPKVLVAKGDQVFVDFDPEDLPEVRRHRARVVSVAAVKLKQVPPVAANLLEALRHRAQPVNASQAHCGVGVAERTLHLLVHEPAAVRQVQGLRHEEVPCAPQLALAPACHAASPEPGPQLAGKLL